MSRPKPSEPPRYAPPATHLPLFSAAVQAGRSDQAIFRHYSVGPAIESDDVRLDAEPGTLIDRLRSLVARARNARHRKVQAPPAQVGPDLGPDGIIPFQQRVFGKVFLHRSAVPEPLMEDLPLLLGPDCMAENTFLLYSPASGMCDHFAMVSGALPHAHLAGPARRTVALPRHTFDPKGGLRDNINTWAVERFRDEYGALHVASGQAHEPIPPSLAEVRAARSQGIRRRAPRERNNSRSITSTDLFHYTYAVLQDEASFAMNGGNTHQMPVLIPLHPVAEGFCALGKELLDLHVGYEMLEAWPLVIVPLHGPENERERRSMPTTAWTWRPRVRIERTEGILVVEGRVRVEGIPPRAWEHRIGERPALERVVDHFKELVLHPGTDAKQAREAQDRHVERFVRCLRRVCRLSMETLRIRAELAKLPHAPNAHR